MKKIILSIFILLVSLCLAACGDAAQESRIVQLEDEHNDNTEDAHNDNTEDDNGNSKLYDETDTSSAPKSYTEGQGFLYDGACFALYEMMGESDNIVYIAEREGELCISFDDIYYIPLCYSEAKEGYDAYPPDDAGSHIIIQETTVNGAFGIEIMSSGSYGKYFGEYIRIPDRDRVVTTETEPSQKADATEEVPTSTDEFVKKEITIDYYKIPEVYLKVMTDEEIDFYNRFVTAFLNYEPKVEQENANEFAKVWSVIRSCFVIATADLELSSGYDLDDKYVYLNYLSKSKEEHDKIIQEFEARVQYFFDDIDEKEEGAELARHIYDNFTSTLEYNYDVVQNDTRYKVNAYTSIMDGDGICFAYTQAYTFLIRQAGFEEFPVSTDDHEWGVIKLDGKYYFVDCTWDSSFEPCYYEYFAFGLDKRIQDGFSEDEMYISECDDMKLGDYAKIEREDYK